MFNYILKLLKQAFKNIRQNMGHNFIVIIFVIAAVFFMNVVLSTFRHCIYLNTFVKSSGLYDSYMYAGTPSKEIYRKDKEKDMEWEAEDYVKRELRAAKEEGIIDGYFPVLEVESDICGTRARFFFGDYELLKGLSFPMAKGKWFDKYSYEEKDNSITMEEGNDLEKEEKGDMPVPIVVGNGLKSICHVGQTIRLNYMDCIVIGVLKHNAQFFNCGRGGSGLSLNGVMQQADNMVILAKEKEDEYHLQNNSFIIKLPDGSRDISEKAVLEKIADIVDTFSFKYLADTAYKDNLSLVEMQATLSVLAMLVCIVGVGCESLLSFVRGKERQAVCFLCGMDKKTSILVNLIEGVLRLYVPALVGIYVFILFYNNQEGDGYIFDLINIFFTMAVISLIFAGTLIRTLGIAKKNDELAALRS